jgi:GAF domain-containing protein
VIGGAQAELPPREKKVTMKVPSIRLNSQKALSRHSLMPKNHGQAIDEGVMGYAYHSASIVNVGNVGENETFKNLFVRTCAATVSELCMPIWMYGKIVSLLNVEDAQENAFSPEEVESLRVLINQAGAVFERIHEGNLVSLQSVQLLASIHKCSLLQLKRPLALIHSTAVASCAA